MAPQPGSWKRQAQALNAIISYCLAASPQERLTTLGAKWSLGNVLDPANVVIDPGALNTVITVDSGLFTADYVAEASVKKGVPVIVQGGCTMRNLNDKLGKIGLAIQTSGANDGHLIAGCIATGTHGSALQIGAVHDTVLAMMLITGPNQGVLLQPSKRRFSSDLATWFANATGMKISDLCDDDLFYASQVALGSLGFVHSVIVEAVPLYQLVNTLIAKPLYDADVWHAIETLDTSKLSPSNGASPYHFSVVLSPYAQGGELGSFCSLMWKQSPVDPYAGPLPATAMLPSDTSRLLSALIGAVDSSLTAAILRHVVVSMTAAQFKAGTQKPMFPGQVFGPTNLPQGNGRSTEIAVDHKQAVPALKVILAALQQQAALGHHILGALGVRFVKKTNALLGMNIHDMSCYIEVPSLGSPDLSAIQQAVWDALVASKIPYTCHWGQEYGMTASTVSTYFGDRVTRWKNARAKLLPTPEQRAVFCTPILNNTGLI